MRTDACASLRSMQALFDLLAAWNQIFSRSIVFGDGREAGACCADIIEQRRLSVSAGD